MDIGHGTGKGILSGAFMHQFERCWGIEILEGLQDVSLRLKAVYDNYIETVDSAEYEAIFGWPTSSAPAFDPVMGDMFEIEWHGADMIFANSTCYTADMMEIIYSQSLKCKKGSWFVSMSKRLPHAERVTEDNPVHDDLHWEFILAIKL